MEELSQLLSNMDLAQVVERLLQLDVEVRAMQNVSDIENAADQKKMLLERKAELENLEQRKQATLDLQSGKATGKLIERGDIHMENTMANDAKNYRSAWLKHVRGIELSDAEKRAFSSASNSAAAVIPTETAQEIIKKVKQVAPLLDEITLLQVEGNVTFAVEGTKADATLHTENGDITGSADTLTQVSLTAYEVTKLVQVSKTVNTMSIDTFESWLTDMLAEKIAEKIGAYLITGTGSSQPTGVEKAATWGATNSVTVTVSGTLSTTNVQTLIGLLSGSYDKNAKFLMSKKTLFTDFMPLQDNSKNSIVTVQGNQYFVYGYPVMLDENVTVHNAYLGDFKKIVGNLSEAITVTSGFDIKSNSYMYLGSAMFDSKVADGEAFVKLVKATA